MTPTKALLSAYRYDPLDRLIGHANSNTPEHQLFYCKNRLASEIKGAMQCSIMQHKDLLLAEHQTSECAITLLFTDQQRSVLSALTSDKLKHTAYTPYGHSCDENILNRLLGFNGERTDPTTGNYLLGNGYRAFNPVLMRFNSPDVLSPFLEGGINAYAYCLGDPVNRSDRSGASSLFGTIQDTFNLVWNHAARLYYKNHGKLRARAVSSLNNVASNTRVIQGEDVILKWNIKHNKTKIRTIKSIKDLDILEQPNTVNKYILNKNNKLIIGTIADNMDESIVPSHASIARHASNTDKISSEVISAGYLIRTDNGYTVTNHSGHYLPTPERTTITKFKLRGMGAKVNSQNIDFS
ncbi:RHS repeat-associated core domain-containing protein|uniref:RHS repeat-associated core domain-containing protein n=1 Tax=Pseudomonas sp. SbOxS1 TaxID=2723884 RepID=UPI0015D265F7|nr:RHS repeat-associated core domain-containing protein [Pseudomonas sp. SbOxS1]NYU07451.1 RHS repeat-associated core domain-containing protein [Pseudomonas sp. SbOxS1]